MSPLRRLVLLAGMCALAVSIVAMTASPARSSTSAFVRHCHSSPDALAWCELLIWLETPGAAEYHAWRTNAGLHPAIARHFGTGPLGRQAQRVARCESELNPRALNHSSGAAGLFQVMPFWARRFAAVTGRPYYDGRFSADASARFARWLWGTTGDWSHWMCQP